MITTGYTPFSKVARRIPWLNSRAGERLLTFAMFSLAPSVIFWLWYLLQGGRDIRDGYQNLSFAMPVTSLWITLGPLLMQHGEFALDKLLIALNERSRADASDSWEIQRTVDRADRCYYWVTIPVALAAVMSVWLGNAAISSTVHVQGLAARAGGLIVICCVGFTSASGMWGCAKSLSIVRTATRAVIAEWRPFRSRQPSAIPELQEFCWSIALIFSFGSLSLPTLFVIQERLPVVARMIVLAFVGVLTIGGLLLFTVPTRWVRGVGTAQKDRLLDALAAPIEHSQDVVLDSHARAHVDVRRRAQILRMALALRAEVSTLDPVPVPQLLSRGAATLLLPLAVSVLQVLITKLI